MRYLIIAFFCLFSLLWAYNAPAFEAAQQIEAHYRAVDQLLFEFPGEDRRSIDRMLRDAGSFEETRTALKRKRAKEDAALLLLQPRSSLPDELEGVDPMLRFMMLNKN